VTPRLLSRIDDLSEEDWNSLEGTDTAFTCHQFLSALEGSGCVSSAKGWIPSHLLWEDQGELLAAMPLYRKYHSYGEYVFDWSWAEAFQQTGQNYYPKLLCAIPYTPVPGPRLFFSKGQSKADLWRASLNFLKQKLAEENLSSLHLLFPESDLDSSDEPLKLLRRQDVQFVWSNKDFQHFDDFLATLKSSKRKQIRRERRKIEEQGIEVSVLQGREIDPESLAFFCMCYQATYLKRSGHAGYLSDDFFQRLYKFMPERLLLVVAHRAGKNLGCALFFIDEHQLSGRYWGCVEDIDCLHFELCYYQGIDFCISHKLGIFNPGTQGEHKLVRGFEPLRTRSYHLFDHAQFSDAVRKSLVQEEAYIDAYEVSAKNHLPFRSN